MSIFCILTPKKAIFKPIKLSLFRSKQWLRPSAESLSSDWSVLNKQLGVQRWNMEKCEKAGPAIRETVFGRVVVWDILRTPSHFNWK